MLRGRPSTSISGAHVYNDNNNYGTRPDTVRYAVLCHRQYFLYYGIVRCIYYAEGFVKIIVALLLLDVSLSE